MKKFTEEHKRKISESKKGKKWIPKDEIRWKKKLSDSMTGNPKVTGRASTEEKEKERKKKISDTMKKNKKSGGRRHGSGRGKKGWYKSYWCDSSWELAFVIYNLEHNIGFKRNKEKFYYIFENEEHYWLPDFIVDNVYHEVKGYEDKKAKVKHSSFDKPLKVLKSKEMKKYIDYTKNKYGNNFIELYE